MFGPSVVVEEDVLRLQISVDDFLANEGLDSSG